MRLWDRFEAINGCVTRCSAGKTATAYYYLACQSDPAIRETSFSFKDIKECHEDLEPTYIVRVYAEFEDTLRDYWKRGVGKTSQPKAKDLIDGIASHRHMRSEILTNVHAVRNFRNSLVHGGATPPVTLAESKKYLCQFLNDLPRQW